MGVGALLVGLSPAMAFGMAVGALLLTGFMNPMTNGPVHAIFQSVVAPEMQGRVFAVIGSACSAMSPLGMAIAGPVADALGVHSWFLMAGASCIAMAIVGFVSPVVMGIETNHRSPAAIKDRTPATAALSVSAGGDS
jgi:DHA3 family macrolide efflux protein-like MFS transporter